MTPLLLVVALAVAGAVALGTVAVLVGRNRARRNRVVPDVPTPAPAAWAGAHTPLARLHRRLRAAVEGARAVPDPDGALIRARHEVEQAALAVDDHLVALHGLSERERASRMGAAAAAVASVEAGAAALADTVARSRGRTGPLPAVEAALERARLVAEARAELDAEDPTTATPAWSFDATGNEVGSAGGAADTGRAEHGAEDGAEHGEVDGDVDGEDGQRPQPSTG